MKSFLPSQHAALAVLTTFLSVLIPGICAAEDVRRAVAEVVPGEPTKPLVIIWTGDGGWHQDLDNRIGAELTAKGYGVVGFDTNTWFSTERTRAQTGRTLSDLINRYIGRQRRRIILIGWSYGADVLPIAFNTLSEKEKQNIGRLILLSVSQTTQLQITLTSRMGLTPGNIPVGPELARLPRDKLVCVYNSLDKVASGCIGTATMGAQVIEIPGDHAFDHNAKGVVERLLPYIDEHIQ